jgi:hypothetical protein
MRDDLATARGTLQCVQRAGDIIYVPTLWGHGVVRACAQLLVHPVRACVRVTLPAPQLNLEDAVGVALEFGIASTRY